MRFALLVISVTAVGCGTIRFSPAEVCARDGMIFSGRNYEARSTPAGAQESTGVVCSRPSAPAERCEVEAARASGEAKNALCRRRSTNADCDEANSHRSYTKEQAQQIEAQGQAVYDRAVEECVARSR